MSVVEPSRILQPKSKHSVKTDVSDPYERLRKNRRAIRPERVTSQYQWSHVGVDGIVCDRSNANIGVIAQQGKWKPTALPPVVGEEADDKHSRTFKMQEWPRIHSLCLSVQGYTLNICSVDEAPSQ